MSQDIDAIFRDLYELWNVTDEASLMFGIPKPKSFRDLVELKLVIELKRLNDREGWREKMTDQAAYVERWAARTRWIKELKDGEVKCQP